MGLVGVLVAAAMVAMALLATSVAAHHGDFYAEADCYGWKVGAKYVGDEDRRVDVDVTVNGEHIVSSDTGYHDGQKLFERSGVGSVDATGTIKVYFKKHGTWKLESKRSLDFHFDFSPCVPTPTATATPTETPPAPTPTATSTPTSPPEVAPTETPPGVSTSTATGPQTGSEVLGVSTGPRALPTTGSEQSSGGSDAAYLALMAAGLAVIAGVGVLTVSAVRSRR
jgi:hypothetical protein